ncbi:uncharacterized protein LOC119386370 [Rhipicephalus sanguineus]|uniref:uncharacterized protein LOC119386370 n=1 Tax=Rhipicephalus sanguineus TaxID=34632 RepID=UPI001895B610|nr:uncharacterized protein LOC119386370 [Rhipicephalus sanguineus]
MRLEKARIEAELEVLQHEKEAAAADAQASALEAAVEQDGGECVHPHPPIDRAQRVSSYITEQATIRDAEVSSLRATVVHARSQSLEHAEAANRHTDLHHYQQPPAYTPPPNSPSSELVGVLKFLCRKDLVSTGLTKFDDRPENFRAWKSSFKGVIRDVDLSAQEELDLLIKWLGPESSRQVWRLKSVHVDDFSRGLNVVWKRLDDTFGRPEAIEDALLKRLEDFPKIPYRDNAKLQDLGDLLLELEAPKTDPYLSGLSYLDTARGVNKIVSKLPSGLQENWMSVGTKYKQQHKTAFPPFSVFSKFVQDQASMRNDPSFIFQPQNASSSFTQQKEEITTKTSWQKSSVSARKTNVDHAFEHFQETTPKELPEPKSLEKWCPHHKRPHPLERCRAFREIALEERITFLRAQGICLRCCLSANHTQWQCKVVVKCHICSSGDHATALHPSSPCSESPEPADSDNSSAHHSEGRVTSTRTEVASTNDSYRSCAKICLVDVIHQSQPESTLRAYAILDEQSNRSLVRPELLDEFNVEGTPTRYTLRTCSGSTEVVGKIAQGFFVRSVSGDVKLPLPPLLECDNIPDNREEIPTPDAARNYPHLSAIATHIPPLEEARILLLLGRDVLRVHKVRQTINGPLDAPYAQRLDLGWVIVGDVCMDRARKTGTVNVFKTHVPDNERPSINPCTKHFNVKEPPVLCAADGHRAQNDFSSVTPSDDSLAPNLFKTTREDNERALAIEDRSNNWVAHLPFRSPRGRLPNKRDQALSRLYSLRRTLRNNQETRERFVNFLKELFVKGHAAEAPPLNTKKRKK